MDLSRYQRGFTNKRVVPEYATSRSPSRRISVREAESEHGKGFSNRLHAPCLSWSCQEVLIDVA
jgi:hypothetical protein